MFEFTYESLLKVEAIFLKIDPAKPDGKILEDLDFKEIHCLIDMLPFDGNEKILDLLLKDKKIDLGTLLRFAWSLDPIRLKFSKNLDSYENSVLQILLCVERRIMENQHESKKISFFYKDFLRERGIDVDEYYLDKIDRLPECYKTKVNGQKFKDWRKMITTRKYNELRNKNLVDKQ